MKIYVAANPLNICLLCSNAEIYVREFPIEDRKNFSHVVREI